MIEDFADVVIAQVLALIFHLTKHSLQHSL